MRVIALIIALVLLSGCSLFKKDITVTAEIEKPIFIHPAPPNRMFMREVEFTVVNKARLEEILNSLGDNDEFAMFVLTAKGYENISQNTAEALRYIKDQQTIILYYREAIEHEDSESDTSE